MPQVEDLFATLRLNVRRDSFTAGDRLIRGIRNALIGIGAFQAGQGIKDLIQSTADAADEAAKLAVSIGSTAEQIQFFDFASQSSGTSLNALTGFIKEFQAQSERISAFGDVGAQVRFFGAQVSAATARQSPLEFLRGIADRAQAIEDPVRRAAFVSGRLGTGFAELTPLLAGGSAGIDDLIERFERFSFVIDNETAKSFEELKDRQLDLSTAFEGLRNRIVVGLLPGLKSAVEATAEWIVTNRELLATNIERFLRGVGVAIRIAARGFVAVNRAFEFLVENAEETRIVLASLIAAFVLLKAGAIASAVASAAAWVAALAPFLLLAALLTPLILVVEDLWRAFTGGESVFRELFEAAKTWLQDRLGTVLVDIADKVGGLLEDLGLLEDFRAGESIDEGTERAEETIQQISQRAQANPELIGAVRDELGEGADDAFVRQTALQISSLATIRRRQQRVRNRARVFAQREGRENPRLEAEQLRLVQELQARTRSLTNRGVSEEFLQRTTTVSPRFTINISTTRSSRETEEAVRRGIQRSEAGIEESVRRANTNTRPTAR